MKTFYIYLLLMMISISGISQVDTVYYSDSWKKTNRTDANYYRTINDSENGFEVNDYDMDDNLLMSGNYNSIDPEIENGHFVFYSSKGLKTVEGDFIDGEMRNIWQYYNKKGKILKELDYNKLSRVNTELDFKKLESHFIRNRQIVDNMPTFENGDILIFTNYLKQEFNMPTIPDRLNISGRVFVQFIVDKEGNMVNTTIQMSKHPHIDCEIRRIIANAPQWRPASHKGEKLEIPITIPFEIGQ